MKIEFNIPNDKADDVIQALSQGYEEMSFEEDGVNRVKNPLSRKQFAYKTVKDYIKRKYSDYKITQIQKEAMEEFDDDIKIT